LLRNSSVVSKKQDGARRWHVKRHYEEQLLDDAISKLELEEPIERYLRSRYLEYLRWLEDGSAVNLILYYCLRIPAMVIAAIVPALVALNPGSVGRAITVVLGVVVAAATAVEHFLNSGHRWRHYRGTAELMKSEAWLYLELAGSYAKYRTLADAFPRFVERAETLMRTEVREYVSTIVAEQQTSGASSSGGASVQSPHP
jgi:hypothetical protein